MKVGSLEFDLLANVARLQQDMNRAQGVMNRSLGAIEQRVERTMASIRRAQMMLGSAFALMGAGFSLSKTTQSITSFEDAMLRLQATSRASASEMAQMEEQARKLGATTRYSASQAADAQNFLAMAGFNTSEVLSATADVIQFASAASIDLGRSADIASNVLGQMRLPVASLSKVMDTLINTTQSSNTNVDQLAEALGYVGPVASAAGIEIDELSAAIGVLGDAGIQGSRAGTGLQGVIQRLINVTPAAESALARYGLTVADVDITTHGLTEVLYRLNEANLSAGDSMSIFGQVSAASALNLSAASERVKELTEANVEAANATSEVASLLDSGLSAAFASVSSAIEEMMLQTGDGGLTGALKVLAVTTAGVISDFNGLLPEFAESSGISQEFARNIEVLSNALKTLGAVAIATFGGRLIAALTTSSAAFIKANIEAMRYQATLARMAGVSSTAAAGISVMSGVARGALAVFGGPIGLIASVGLAALAFTDFSKSSKDVSADLSALKGPLDEVIEKFSSLESAAQGALMAGLAVEIRESEKELRGLASTTREMTQFTRDLGDMSDTLYNAFTQAAKGMEVDWNSLSRAIQDNATITDEARVHLLGVVGEASSLTGTIIELEDKYYALAETIDLANQVTDDSKRAQGEADAAKLLAAKNTQEYIDKLDAETKKMENSIKTTRQLANEYILLHGLQGGNVDAIMEAVKRNEAAAKAVESHRSSLSRLGGTAKTVESEAEKAAKAAKRRAEEFERARKSAYQTQISHISSIHDEAQALEDQVRVFGQGKFALEQLAIARLQEQRTMLSGFKGSEEQIELIEREIDAIERRMAAGTQLEELQEEARVRQEMTDEHIRMNEEIGRTLTDALMRGFEDGKSFAKNMRDTVINMFRTMVLRPIIEPVMQGVAGAITGALGVGGGSGGVMGSLGGVGSLFTNFGGSMAGMVQSLGGSMAGLGGPLGDLGANIIMSADTIGNALDFAGTALSYGNSILNLTKGNYGAAAGGAIGTYFGGPVGSFLGSTLGGMLDGAFKGETRSGGGFVYDPNSRRAMYHSGPSGGYGGQQTLSAVESLFSSAADTIVHVFEGAGVDAGLAFFHGAFESSSKGRGGTFSGGDIVLADGTVIGFGGAKKGDGFGGKSGSTEEMFANLQAEMHFSVLEAWKTVGSEMPTMISDMLTSIDVRSLSAEQAQGLVAGISNTVGAVNSLSEAFNQMPMLNLRDLTFDATGALMQFAGGLDAITSGVSTYYQNFYSESERQMQSLSGMASQLSGLNASFPTTKAGFRELADGLDLSTEAGQQLYATLMNMSGAAASFYDYVAQQSESSFATISASISASRDDYLASLQEQHQAAQKAIRDEYSAKSQAIRSSITSINERLRDLNSVFNALGSGIKSLREQSELASQLHREASLRVIEDAIAASKVGKSLTNIAQLQDSIQSASKLDAKNFTSLFDFESERAETVNRLKELESLTGGQIDVQELQLNALNKQLEQLGTWQDKQLELLQKQYEEEQEIAKQRFEKILAEEKMRFEQTLAEMLNEQANQLLMNDSITAGAQSTSVGLSAVQRAVDSSASRIATAISNIKISVTMPSPSSGGAGSRLPAFADGGSYRGGLAVVGEQGPEIINFDKPGMVYTAAQSRNLMANAGAGNDETAGLLRQLIGEIKEMRYEARQMVINTQKILGLVDDATESSLSDESIIVTY